MKTTENQVVIITGAGAGIGHAMALLFAREGAKVVCSDIRQDRLDELIKEISNAGGEAIAHTTDVADEAQVQDLIATTVKTYGTPDVLINNAGILDDFMPAAEVSSDLWHRVMRVNVDGPFYAIKHVLPLMLEKGKGNIINVSSIGGFCGSRAGVAYTTSKHAVIGMSRNVGFQYATKGIRCNVIAPGGVNTKITEGVQPSQFGYEKLMSGIGSNIRSAEPMEIAEVALFLASDKSSFINGAVVTADGGWTAY